MPEDLREYVKVPGVSGGKRQIITAKPTPAFKAYQRLLDERIKAIEERDRAAGARRRHPALRHHRRPACRDRSAPGRSDKDNEAGQQAQRARRQRFPHLERDRRDTPIVRPDGKPFEMPGAGQLIFSDLGTISVEKPRAASRPIAGSGTNSSASACRRPRSPYMQDFKKSEAKQRLFDDFDAGKVRFLIGSSDTMGTGRQCRSFA